MICEALQSRDMGEDGLSFHVLFIALRHYDYFYFLL